MEPHAPPVDFQQYRTLMEVSESICAHRDLKALLQELSKRLRSLTQFEFIGLHLHDRPERHANVLPRHGGGRKRPRVGVAHGGLRERDGRVVGGHVARACDRNASSELAASDCAA